MPLHFRIYLSLHLPILVDSQHLYHINFIDWFGVGNNAVNHLGYFFILLPARAFIRVLEKWKVLISSGGGDAMVTYTYSRMGICRVERFVL